MTWKIVSLRLVAATALAVATLSLSACGGSDDQSPAGTPAAPAATTPIDLPSAGATPADDPGDCSGGAANAVKKAVTSSAVTKIDVIGGCTEVSIETSLAPTAKADGVKICNEAAKVAYTGNVMAVSVDSSDGHELSAGIKGAPCV